MSFCCVDYEGNYENINSFLKEKVPSSEISQSNNHKILVKLLTSDDKDELMFFSNFTMEDSITQICKVIYIIKYLPFRFQKFLRKNMTYLILLFQMLLEHHKKP